MRTWPMEWDYVVKMVYRKCPHGAGHLDPDQYEYLNEKHLNWLKDYHECDGCCEPPELPF